MHFKAAIKRPVVLVGESGTSKSATIQDFLRRLSPEQNLLLNINFSSRTSSMDVQAWISQQMKPIPPKRFDSNLIICNIIYCPRWL